MYPTFLSESRAVGKDTAGECLRVSKRVKEPLGDVGGRRKDYNCRLGKTTSLSSQMAENFSFFVFKCKSIL
jgi:hypothetical protein